MMKGKKLIKVLATAVSVLPPLGAGLYCFPLWLEEGQGKSISGICILIALLCALPFLRQIRDYFKSPSAVVLWLVLAASLTLVRNVIDDIMLISYVALVSNAIGSLLFLWARQITGDK